MDLGLSEEQELLKNSAREFLENECPEEHVRAMEEDERGYSAELWKKMADLGWHGLAIPEEYGGAGFSYLDLCILVEEVGRALLPGPFIPNASCAGALILGGTDAQKKKYLPAILAGKLMFGVGYTEPAAGTDLASLKTRAEKDGDEYVINGQKIFTTHAHVADYIWLAARTDPKAKKHAGISMILVPTDTPGYSCTPIYTLGKERTNATYYQVVRVPIKNLVGPENGGWRLITSQLNHERITLATPGHCESMMDEVWGWAARTECPTGGSMLEQQWVQIHLARVYAKLQALQVLNWRSAWRLTEGHPDMAEASALKVMGTEFFVEAYNLLLEIVGAAGIVLEGQPGTLFGGLLETAYRGATTLTFGGGVNEVQRDIIAMAGLGLPRARARA